ncbi:hypothetical protein [Gemmata sp.]|uniref:hypothetical protein n=1 Tax=Gemmata sp. TaxID=1914242 RepID=UPI003F71EC51
MTDAAPEPGTATPPVACPWCHGSGVEPFEDGDAVGCLACDGGGLVAARVQMVTSHKFPRPGARRAVYEPGRCRLTITQGRTVERYALLPFPADAGFGFAFAALKDGETEPHTLRCGGRDGSDCSCGGTSFLSTERANERAWNEGRDTHPSAGCKHLDAVGPLVAAGWFGPPKR